MQIRSANFETSAAKPSQFLRRPIPHVVFAGKSNVGKSSLLNKLLNRKKLAKTSQTPGKTRLVNYFLINDRFYFVDIPGYGFAKVSRRERAGWGELIETYLETTPFIAVIFLLIDIRHEPNANDRQMLDWLQHHRLPFHIILTKADKLSNNKIINQQTRIAKELDLDRSELVATSATSGRGMKDVWQIIAGSFDGNWNQSTKEAAT
ncbi:MAG: ribosome biogenesis GTP-binding protein YihA/YsxC [Acidobacteriota bacterium]|nr:ribosome biogenesis GTP-binding protein YihA/YsxC [Acidobacteriota bacterium]